MRATVGQSLTRLKAHDSNGTLDEPFRRALRAVDPDWNADFYARLWSSGLTSLTVYVAREGHASPPQTHLEDGFPLGRWVANRRGERRAGTLSDDRARTLETLTGWAWDPFADRFAVGLAHLDVFIAENRSARVPRQHRQGGFPLGAWCDRRRIDREAGRLTAERVAALETRPGWEWRPADADYARTLRLLDRYAGKAGHTRVPRTHIEDGENLGSWVAARRRDYSAGKLTAARTEELETRPGWLWSAARPR